MSLIHQNINKFNNDQLFKIIEKLLKTKNLLDNSLAESLLFQILFQKQGDISYEEVAKLFESVLRNNNFENKDTKFLEFYQWIISILKDDVDINSANVNQLKDDSKLKENIEKYICKHFENNFFSSSDTKRLDDYILHENYIKIYNDESRFAVNYSVFSLFSMMKFLRIFEEFKLKEILNTEIYHENNEFDYNKIFENLFKGKKNDVVVQFINNHVENIIEDINQSSVINSEAEQKLCFSLFVIKKIIKDFPFYFTTKDFDHIFNKIKHIKDYPIPIGSFALDLFEVIINEMYFQGISILNSLQRRFYIDSHFADEDFIDTRDFKKIFISQNKLKSINILGNINSSVSNSNECSDITNKIIKNIAGFSDWKNESVFNTTDKNIINSSYVCNKDINQDKVIINFKDLLIKLLLNIIYNLKEEMQINYQDLKNLIIYYKNEENYLTKKSSTLEIENKNVENNNNFIKYSIEFLIKIINIGLDKDKNEFNYDIKEIIKSILSEIDKIKGNDIFEEIVKNKLERKDFLALSSFREKLRTFTYCLTDREKDDYFEIYINLLKNIFLRNFISNNAIETDEDTANYFKNIAINLIKEIKMNILLIEEENVNNNIYDDNDNSMRNISTISNFINKLFEIYKNIDNYYKNKENVNNPYKSVIDDFFKIINKESSKSNDLFETTQNNIPLDFNSYFNLELNFLIYLLPGNTISENKKPKENLSSQENNTGKRESLFFSSDFINSNININNTSFLCRYISKKDYIYKTLINNLWSNMNFDSSEDEFINAKRYEVLKESLDLYAAEAENIFNLYLYRIELFKTPYQIFNLNRALTNTGNEINDSIDFLFWKNMKIIKKEEDAKFKKNSDCQNSIELHCVDIFNLEYQDSVIKFDKFNFEKLFIFNITSELNTPVHFNSISNNGWLEVFLKEKNYIDPIIKQDKNRKTQAKTSNETNYNDFLLSNLEQDVTFKNYKVKKIIFESDTFKNYIFRYDDHSIIDTTSINKIEISRYERNDRHMHLPIAVFSPIN